jgi:hypothetical protein
MNAPIFRSIGIAVTLQRTGKLYVFREAELCDTAIAVAIRSKPAILLSS